MYKKLVPWEYKTPLCDDFAFQPSSSNQLFFQKRPESPTRVECNSENTIIKKEIISPVVEQNVEESDYKTYSRTVKHNQGNNEQKPHYETVKKEKTSPVLRSFRRRSMSLHSPMKIIESDPNEVTKPIKKMEISHSDKNRIVKRDLVSNNLRRKSSSMPSLLISISKSNKYMTTAEAIYHLQKDTPDRFHSYSKKQVVLLPGYLKQLKLHPTIPQSPNLTSKRRVRPVKALSQKEIEELEFQESKKYRIKAQPVPTEILQGAPNLAPVERKPVTRFEPFNLTEVKKKPLNILENPLHNIFVARPMPKRIFEKPAEIQKKFIAPTIAKSPNITKPQKPHLEQETYPKVNLQSAKTVKNIVKSLNLPGDVTEHIDYGSLGHSNVPLSHKFNSQPCKPKPFSFYEKDKIRDLMKKQKIQKFLEEEKKLREFHANPVPSIVRKRAKNANSPQSPNSTHSADSKYENKENRFDKAETIFKARPCTVSLKKPFVPAPNSKPITVPYQIHLTTEERAKKRQEFGMHLKEKEIVCEELRKKEEELLRKQEEEEVQALRAQLVHKAAPVRQYTPLIVQPSKLPLTVATSPNFTLLH